jgi:hypothetical protein
VTKFPLKGECWSKTKRVKDIPWSEILVSPECKYNYKGMPISLVKEKWHFLLSVIKGFITCEGRYSLFFIYHFRLLMVFMDYKLNMLVFLLKILSKMAQFYQRKNLSSERNVFHHGLVKILVEFQLK